MSIPIFVVGTNRSGTTWLSNIISSHPDVAAIQSSNHHKFYTGVIESFYFSHVYWRYGDLSIRQNFIEFVEAIGVSDYFKMAGVDKQFLYDLYPSNYEEIFRTVMDHFSANSNAKFWLEKSPTHSKLLPLISSCFKDAKFISIQRNVYDVAASGLGLRLRYNENKVDDIKFRRATIKSSIKNYYQLNKAIKKFSKNKSIGILQLTYEDLVNDYNISLDKICAYLKLDNSTELLSKFPKNTSFTEKSKKTDIFNENEKKLLFYLNLYYSSIPYPIISFKDKLRSKFRKRFSMFSNSKLPNWFYNFHDKPNSVNNK